MIKAKIKENKGITLISVVLSIIVLLVLTSIIIYNVQDNFKIEKLGKLESDIANLRDKISIYYSQYEDIPAKAEYTNTGNIDSISSVVDIGKFLVIDLGAIDNLTLNYGKDYEKVKNLSNFKSGNTLTSSEMRENTDLYIINETSHNIFYVKGVSINNHMYYTDYYKDEKDVAPVQLRI